MSTILSRSIGNKWVDMKLFGISPNPVVVDQDQTVLNDLMEMQGLNFIRLKLCHSKVLGAGYQCITLDILRTGTL